MKKSVLTLMTVLGLGASAFADDSAATTYNVATPFVDATVVNNTVRIFDVVAANDDVVTALKLNGQTVNDWRPNDTNAFMYIWENTLVGVPASDTTPLGVGYSSEEGKDYLNVNVSTIGWSGAGYYLGTNEGAPGHSTMHWNDNTRIHIAYRTTGDAPASVALIVADADDNGTPAKVAVGTDYVDGSSTYTSVGLAASDEWQAIDLSFADLKELYPSFNYVKTDNWVGNILSFLCGGVAGNNFAMDAIYFYTPVESISPVPGTYTSLYEVTLSWGGQEVTPGDNWTTDVNAGLRGINGSTPQWSGWETPDGMEYQYPVFSIVDAYGDIVYPEDEFSSTNPGVALKISGWSINNWSDEGDEFPYIVDFNIPDGLVNIDGEPYMKEEDAENPSYTIIPVYFDYLTTPSKNSMLPSISQITVMLEDAGDYSLAINEESTAPVVYGSLDILSYTISNPAPVKSVTLNDEGNVVIELPEEYSAEGTMAIQIPSYYLKAVPENGGDDILLEGAQFQYNISLYIINPKNYATVQGEIFDSFEVASVVGATEVVEGKLGEITVTRPDPFDENNPQVIKIKEVEQVDVFDANFNQYEGLKFILESPIDQPKSSAIVNIPAGTLSFNGSVYNEAISVEYFIYPPLPEPVADPASGSTVNKLEVIELSWNDSPLEVSPYYEPEYLGYPTIQVGEGEPVDLSLDCFEIQDVKDDVIEGGRVISSKLVINFGENPYTEAGTYTITIPAGYLFVSEYEMETEEVVLVYTVDPNSGVDAVAVDGGKAVYYDLQGRRVANPERGIYIRIRDGKATKVIL